MWFWGALLGLMAGAAMFGWKGAVVGTAIGWLAGMLISKQDASSKETAKSRDLEKRLAHTQKVLEDVHWRLARLEKEADLPPSPFAQAVMAAQEPAVAPQSGADPVQKLSSEGTVSIETQPLPVEPALAATVLTPAPAMPAPSAIKSKMETVADSENVAAPAPAARSVQASSPPARPPPPRSPIPEGPGFIERMLEGNIVAKLGVVVLFLGVGFLLKHAYDRGIFPPELRLLGVAVAAVVMFFLGRRLLEAKRTYALILFGGAMGLMYLDVFFALKTFALISAPLGFLLFAALGIATIALAVKYDARAFAALGLIGAFLAPILASTGSGNHVLLFSYYLLLNLVILGASWFKAWRELNFIGFLFTFAIALFWGYATYTPEHFSTVEPFLIVFFLLYLAIPILFASRQPPELKGLVDATLVFGMPMSAAMLQAALTRGMGGHVLAWSAFGAALIYAALAWALWKREKMRLLAEAHLALAVVFATAVPFFAFRGYPTFAFWTLEGAAIFWMGCRQKSVLARMFALCLQIGAAAYFWSVTQGAIYLDPWWNDRVVGCGLIAAASLLTAWFMHRFEESISAREHSLQALAITWGSLWLFSGFVFGAWQYWTEAEARISALLIFAAAVFVLFEWLGTWGNWRLLRLTSRAHVLLIGSLAMAWAVLAPGENPLSGDGLVAWPLTFAAYFYVLHRQRIDAVESSSGWRYQSAWILMLALATWESAWRYSYGEFGWVFGIGVVGVVAAGLRFRLREFATDDEPGRLMRVSNIPLLWALFWWFAGVHGLIETRTSEASHVAVHLVVVTLSILLFEICGSVLTWSALRRTQVLLPLAMLVAALHLANHDINPFMGSQFFAWLMAFVIGAAVLARQERDEMAWRPSWQHAVLFNLALLLVGWELCWRAVDAGLENAWQYAATGGTVALGIAVATFGIVRELWPFGAHATTIRNWSVTPLLVLVFVWTLVANMASSGSAAPLPYIPLLNPLDLAQLALFATALWAMRTLYATDGDAEASATTGTTLVLAASGFFWINAVLLRTVHFWTDVPFDLSALLHSVVAQAALSLLWTSVALVLMYAAGKQERPSRSLWMTGAALLGLVILKLAVNDMGNTGTIARIVSFIGVGVLLLVIGYLAPMPPKVQPAE